MTVESAVGVVIVLNVCLLGAAGLFIFRLTKTKEDLLGVGGRLASDLQALTSRINALKEGQAELLANDSRFTTALAQVGDAVEACEEHTGACERVVGQAHGLLTAMALRDVTGESELEKVIGEGDVQKVISCQSKQRILGVTDKATDSETRYSYLKDGSIESQTHIKGKLKFSTTFAATGMPLSGVVYDESEKPAQKFAYDTYGQVCERTTL